jgi:hypothetical protein
MSKKNEIVLCDDCQTKLTDYVIVTKDFMKYLFVRSGVTKEELQEIVEEHKKPHYHNHKHFIKQTSKIPSFKVDKFKGEGKATKEELELRQLFLDAEKDAYLKFQAIKNNKSINVHEKIKQIKPITDEFKIDCQKVVKKFIPLIWNKSQDRIVERMKDFGIDASGNKGKNEEVYNALIEWKLFQAEQNSEYLRMDLTSKLLGNNYHRLAYGRKI